MPKLDVYGLLTLLVVLLCGIGGCLGAVALGAEELAQVILAFAGGLLVPMPNLAKRSQ